MSEYIPQIHREILQIKGIMVNCLLKSLTLMKNCYFYLVLLVRICCKDFDLKCIFIFQQFFCDICLKSIENHDNYRRHMEVLHSESIVLYLCPLCDLELRWPKNFPAHYEKSHHKSYQEGLEMAKSLKTRVVVIKGVFSIIVSIGTNIIC